MGLGDCSGLVYAVSGVCHQMCNTITCSTTPRAPLASLINWPPSLNASKLAYGNRGIWGHEQGIVDLMRSILSLVGDTCEFGEEEEKALDAQLVAINEHKREAMKRGLVGDDELERHEIVRANAPAEADFGRLLEADAAFMAIKRELDNLLLRDGISYEEYANQANAALRNLVDRIGAILGEAAFAETFGTSPDELDCSVVDPALMPPTYEPVREWLGL